LAAAGSATEAHVHAQVRIEVGVGAPARALDPHRRVRTGPPVCRNPRLLALAEVLDVDLLQAARAKMAHSRARFPVSDVASLAPEKS
jgi:hypothetical protein